MIVSYLTSVPKILIDTRIPFYKLSSFRKQNKMNKNTIKAYQQLNDDSKFYGKLLQKLISKPYLAIIMQLVLFSSSTVLAIPDINPGQRVLDEAGVLTKSSISYIEKSLLKVKENAQTDVYFVSVRNLPYGKDVQDYTKELFEKWKLGEKDVLVVLVSKLAKAGIYYGNQITGLNNEIAQSIGSETYSFKAKSEQYSSAALDVNNRLVSILLEKGDPGVPSVNRTADVSNFKTAKKTEESRSKYIAIIAILLIIAFVVPMIQFFYYVKDD